MRRLVVLTVVTIAACVAPPVAVSATGNDMTIGVPPAGSLYHGVYPGGQTGWEDDLTPADIDAYEAAAGRSVAWVYFSDNWFVDHKFPLDTATWIRERGSLPFIRLMLRSRQQPVQGPGGDVSIARVLSGELDDDLRAWGRAAAAFGSPLIVEYGTEMNGEWFPWNGRWNGGAGAGPRRFRKAYRHIVHEIEGAGAHNITWVFHVNDSSFPDTRWNRFEAYYPGEEVVDWVGLSAYGATTPEEDTVNDFVAALDRVVPRLAAMAPDAPIFVFEFGIPEGNPGADAPTWASGALDALISGRWPQVRGFSWWNETWQNDDDPAHDTDIRVQAVPGLAPVFRDRLEDEARIVDRPI